MRIRLIPIRCYLHLRCFVHISGIKPARNFARLKSRLVQPLSKSAQFDLILLICRPAFAAVEPFPHKQSEVTLICSDILILIVTLKKKFETRAACSKFTVRLEHEEQGGLDACLGI